MTLGTAPFSIAAAAADPITEAYRAIFRALWAWRGVTDLENRPLSGIFAKTNFVDLSDPKGDKQIINRDGITAANTPEITLWPGALVMKPFGSNSKVAEIAQTYTLMIVGDNYAATVADVNAYQWHTMIALFKAGPDLGATFGGAPFISDVRVTSATDTMRPLPVANAIPRDGGAIRRWTSLANIEVQMYFSRQSLASLA